MSVRIIYKADHPSWKEWLQYLCNRFKRKILLTNRESMDLYTLYKGFCTDRNYNFFGKRGFCKGITAAGFRIEYFFKDGKRHQLFVVDPDEFLDKYEQKKKEGISVHITYPVIDNRRYKAETVYTLLDDYNSQIQEPEV